MFYVIRRGSHAGLPVVVTDTRRWLAPRHVLELMSATFYAEAVGMSLYTFLTVAWPEFPGFDYTDRGWDSLQRRLIADLQRFCAVRQVPVAFVWVRERKPGVGPHTHLLLHLGCPTGRAFYFVEMVRGFLQRRYGFGSDGLHFSLGPAADRCFDRLQYICKGLDPGACRYYGLVRRSIRQVLGMVRYPDHKQGVIRIKRSGVSRNLARGARQRGGWQEMRDLDAFRRALEQPYFAVLQLRPPEPRVLDETLSLDEYYRARFSDPNFLYRRRLDHFWRVAQPESWDWPRALVPAPMVERYSQSRRLGHLPH